MTNLLFARSRYCPLGHAGLIARARARAGWWQSPPGVLKPPFSWRPFSRRLFRGSPFSAHPFEGIPFPNSASPRPRSMKKVEAKKPLKEGGFTSLPAMVESNIPKAIRTLRALEPWKRRTRWGVSSAVSWQSCSK